MSKKRIATLVLLLILLCLWWAVIHVPRVERTFWDFCTLGILPWSSKPISSEALWRTLIGCFTISFMVIFRKEIIASMPVRQRSLRVPVQEVMRQAPTAVLAEVRKRDAVAITISNSARKPRRQLMRPALLLAARICIAAVTVGDFMERFVRQVSRLVIAYASKLFWACARGLWRISLIVVTVAVMIWKLIEPHLRRFDQWLNLQVHRNPTTARMLRASNDAWKATSGTYKKLQQSGNKVSQLK